MAWSFALGGAVCVLGQGASYHYGFSAGIFVTFPAGALATVLSFGGVRALRRAELVQSIRAMLGFGVCHILLLFSAISLQASVDPVFGALAWGLALGIAGASIAPVLSRLSGAESVAPAPLRHPARRGGLVFAICGAAAGAMGFHAFRLHGPAGLALGLFLAMTIGGLLLGLAWRRQISRDMPPEVPGPSVALVEESGVSRGPGIPGEGRDSRQDDAVAARGAARAALLAVALLALLVVQISWPDLPFLDLLMTLLGGVPTMLGLGQVVPRAIFVLLLLGLLPLVKSLTALKGARGRRMEPRLRRRALNARAVGVALIGAAACLTIPAIGGAFETWCGNVMLRSGIAAKSEHEVGKVISRRVWDADRRIHEGNMLLARGAWKLGRRAEAGNYLLAAAQTPLSSGLDSFGPSLGLAREMLEAGERDTVLQYLVLCQMSRRGPAGQLDGWIAEIKKGQMPNFDSYRSRQ